MMKEKYYPSLRKGSLWLFVLSLLFAAPAFAQQSAIKGVVKSQDNQESIPGVSVLVKGTQRGTVTDLDGVFNVQAAPGEVLVISFVGYETKEITIAPNQAELEVLLAPALSDLSEVVVIGYGSQRKSDL